MVAEIGLDYGALSNLPDLNITIPTSSNEILDAVVNNANNSTYGFLAYFIMFASIFFLYYILSDKTPYADFNYDDARALCISLGITATLMITLIEINFITNFKAVGMNVVIFLISKIYITIYESKSETE